MQRAVCSILEQCRPDMPASAELGLLTILQAPLHPPFPPSTPLPLPFAIHNLKIRFQNKVKFHPISMVCV